MKNRPNQVVATTGVVLCCLATNAVAQQYGSFASPFVIPYTQNVPGAISSFNTTVPDTTRAWTIVPRIGLSETFTDNVNLTATNTQNDLVTQISPGIRIDANTARLRMYLDYALNGLIYAKETGNNQTQNALNTFGTIRAIDNWLFLDFSGQIAQQTISPFGVQSNSNINVNNNRTETSTYRLSPYIQGELGGMADYFLRYTQSTTKSNSNDISDVDQSQTLGQIRGNTTFQNLNWVLDGSQQNTDYSQGRDYKDQRLRAMLIYRLLPDFRISVSGGYESNNYESLSMEGQSTNGYGFDWRPTERTQVSAFQERRFFGNGHNVILSHRFPLSTIRYTDVRDVAFIPGQFSTAGLGTVYDLYFQQFASLVPDPVERASYVNGLLNQAGVAPNAQAVTDYFNNRPQVQRSQQLSLVLFGNRNSITFLAGRTENQALTLVGDLNGPISEDSRVTQQGLGVNFTHRLSEFTGLSLLVSRQKNESGATNVVDNTLTTYQAGVATRLGTKTFGALTARHNEFDSTTNPYTENAVIATLTMSF